MSESVHTESRVARWLRIALVACAALLAVRLAVFAWASIDRPASGFVAHYTASRLVLDGQAAAALYDDSAFADAVHRFEPGVSDIFGANPPTVALNAIPLALLPYRVARATQIVLILGVWSILVILLARRSGLRGATLVAFVCVALLFDPLFAEVRDAQMHVYMLALVVFAAAAWTRDRGCSTGTALGTALALKSTGFAFWPMLAAQRRWRALFCGAVTVAAFCAVATGTLGINIWSAFGEKARELGRSASLSVTAYQTIISLTRRLTVADTQWNPEPLLDLGGDGIAISWVLTGLVLAGGLALTADRRDEAAFASFAALALAVSPVSLDSHYVLALLPIAVLLGHEKERMGSARGILLAAATALIGIELPFRSPIIGSGALVVFAYPKLYGALLLWGLCLTANAREGMNGQ